MPADQAGGGTKPCWQGWESTRKREEVRKIWVDDHVVGLTLSLYWPHLARQSLGKGGNPVGGEKTTF